MKDPFPAGGAARRASCLAAVSLALAACVSPPTEAPTPAEPVADAVPAAEAADSKAPAPPPAPQKPAADVAKATPDAPPPRVPWTVGEPSIRFKDQSKPSDEDETDEETQRGKASWYGEPFHGRKTANGERYNMYELTAAHKTLPFGTVVKVKDLNSGRSVDVRINDRGPFIDGRVIDLSKAAAEELGMAEDGVKPVSVTVVEKAEKPEPKANGKRKGKRVKANPNPKTKVADAPTP